MVAIPGFIVDEHEELKDFSQPLPNGIYKSIITASELKDTQSGNGQYIKLTYQIIDGEYKGRSFWSQHNIRNSNPQAVAIANQELAQIGRACGKQRMNDTNELHDITMYVRVICEPRSDDKTKMQNRVKNWSSTDSSPQQQPVASGTSSGGAKKPWEK